MVMRTYCSRDVGLDVVANEVDRLQVEEALTDLVTDIWFIAVVVESLAPTFLSFNRGYQRKGHDCAEDSSKVADLVNGVPLAL
jgi:hypothetical protein